MTRNDRRRQVLLKRIAGLKSKMLPLQREMAFVDEELNLIDQFDAAQAQDAQENLGLYDEETA
jgi:hypothetical protein